MHFFIDMKVEEPYYSRFGTGNGVRPDYRKFCWMTKLYPYLYLTYGRSINVTIHVRDAESTDEMKRYYFKVDGAKISKEDKSTAEIKGTEVLDQLKNLHPDHCLLYHPTFSEYPSSWARDALSLISYSKDITYDSEDGAVYVKLDEAMYQYQYNIMLKQTEKQLRYGYRQGWIKTMDEKFIKNNFLVLINDDIYRSFGKLCNTGEDMSSILERRSRGDNRIIFPYILSEKQKDYITLRTGLAVGDYAVVDTESILPVFQMDKIITEVKLKYV